MAEALGATLFEMECKGWRLKRYCVLIWRTVRLIRSCRADAIFFQNPSMVLAAVVIGMKSIRLTRAVLIGDFHNAGVFPPVAQALVPWIVKGCDLVIVSNGNLEERITAMGGRSLSVPDPLPELSAEGGGRQRSGRFQVLMVCSWADDEPVVEVLRAAEILRSRVAEVAVAITGRPALAKRGWTRPLPENVELTGFLSEEEFDKRLKHSDVILDLTTRADCMVCGAYEAVSAEVPIILSGNEAMKTYFSKGAVFTDNTAADIANRVLEAMLRREELTRDVQELKSEILLREREVFRKLSDTVRLIAKELSRE